ncbi:unnamed protein product [Ostreobium quekettii]|uniref:CBS domain-containing protein n=1 Tax=Ostreobium quekettii TaxID=121088 RepID=A0A8S1J9D3_9CHLO|nr:unnamed protein product [Ostreobium quekettii]
MVHDELSVNELMSTEMVCLPAVIKVRELATALRTFSHGGYPVSSEAEVPVAAATSPMRIDGLIARPLLLRLLQRRLGFIKKGQEGGSFPLPRTEKGVLDVLDTIEPYPMRINPRSEQEAILAALSEVDLETDIDLRPFMQRQPFLVNEDASLSRAYRLFRTLGLRHLLVAPSRPLGLGILTRKDMIKENVRLALGEKANREAAKVTASRRGERRIKEKFDAGGARTLVEFMPAFDTAAEQGTAMASAVPRQLIRRSVVPRATRQETEAREAMEQGAAESAAGSS